MTKKWIEHLVALGKSAAALTPIGSGIVTAINEYVPSAHHQALRRATEALHERLNELDSRLEEEYVKTEDFADLFKNCYVVCQRTQHDEKLRAAANILTNALLREGDPDKLAYKELDHFTRCIEHISLEAIRVLGHAIAYAEKEYEGRSPNRLPTEFVRIDFGRLRALLPSPVDNDLLMGLVGELIGVNLLWTFGPSNVFDKGDRYRNYPLFTTPLGYRFVKFVLEPGSHGS